MQSFFKLFASAVRALAQSLSGRQPATSRLCGLVLILTAAAPSAAQTRVYVDGDQSSNGDGTSWGTAYDNLQDALDDAGNSTPSNRYEIWITGGTYLPGTNRSDSFVIPDSVSLYGGFDGTEALLEDREPVGESPETILSGDLNQDDTTGAFDLDNIESNFTNHDENAYHVLQATDFIDDGITLDRDAISRGDRRPSANRNPNLHVNCLVKVAEAW